ncbi:MAG: hypothetical protein ACRDXX_17060, partial [Stackebrandtia sp.]
MTNTQAARRRAARRHWVQVLPTLVREEYWPADGAAGPDAGGEEATPVRRVLDDDVAERIRAVTRGDAVLLHALVTAAAAVCLGARRGHDGVLLSVPPLTQEDVPGVVAVLPVPVAVDVAGSRRQQLLNTRQALLDAYGAQDVDPVWLDEHAPTLRPVAGDAPLGGWLVRHPPIHAPVPEGLRFDGTVEVRSDEDAIQIELDSDSDQHRRAGLAHLADSVVDVIAQIVGAPDESVTTLRRTRPAVREAAVR